MRPPSSKSRAAFRSGERKSNPPGRSPSRSTRSCSHLVKPVSQLAKPRVKADSAIRPHLETTTWQQQQHQRQCQQHERQNNRQAWELLQQIEEVSTRFEIRADGSHCFISIRKVCCFYYFFSARHTHRNARECAHKDLLFILTRI
uniref:(northern house mosquito) hypothetical protein n=1 Tax=Culex pipiens TaxID=7175 RepID=A0A8D8F2G1_CULPI